MQKILFSAIVFFLLLYALKGFSQEKYSAFRHDWMEKAIRFQPALVKTILRPMGIVTIQKNDSAFQGYAVQSILPPDSFFVKSMKSQSGVVLDFGQHLTGLVSFEIEDLKAVADAPLRLKFTFAETLAEATLPFDPYPGILSRGWLQDEIITISTVPAILQIPRRVSFRYLKIEVLGSSIYSDFKIPDLFAEATTSARFQPENLLGSTPAVFRKIDSVCQNTLKECMQTVYEDGPKRDRRLWIGDLYLESLANNLTFKNDSLTKHCLYLLAALSYPDGVLPSNVFEQPQPHAQYNPLFDYTQVYIAALKEYVIATGDTQTGNDLWPVVKEQIQIPKQFIGKDYLIDAKTAASKWWLFFDWNDKLDRTVAMQGCTIWAFDNCLELAKLLHKESEVSELPALITNMKKAARKNFYDKSKAVYVSGSSRQVSYASQAWMILSGVAGKSEGPRIFKSAFADSNVLKPGTPYLYHYVLEALVKCGMQDDAKKIITDYWGGMLNKGADTFWEVFDPSNDFLSPYNSFLVNSYCHAWSCTPSYFIRKYPDIFQR
jgi:alpha-L-rhamnosidase